jgi:two-component system, response regulator
MCYNLNTQKIKERRRFLFHLRLILENNMMNNKSELDEKYVLLVEDNEDDVALTNVAFRKCHIPNRIVVVNDGQEALDFLMGQGQYSVRDTSQVPAVVILDLKLPCISGLEVLKQIRLTHKISRLPVVVLSSSVNQQEIDECERLGINRYYRKPGNFGEFTKIIEEIRYSWL